MPLHVSSTVVLIIRRSKLYYTAYGIVTHCRWPSGAQVERGLIFQPVHRMAIDRCDDTRYCIIQFWLPVVEAYNNDNKFSRYRPGVAQRVGRGIALFSPDRSTRRGWVVSSTPRPHFTPGKDQVPNLQETGWAPGPVWRGGKSRPHRNSIPVRPTRSSVAIPTELPGV